MQPGIFARTFVRPGFEEIFEAVKVHGLACLQFNFACAGLATVPEAFDSALMNRISAALEARSLSMAAISGTCNLIHPDRNQRKEFVKRLQTMIPVCAQLETRVITLCTGTRDPEDMWRAHPNNQSKESWRDLLISLENLAPVAETHGVMLGVEPEPANVVNSARTAAQLLDEVRSPSLKIVFDAANLVASSDLSQQQSILSEAADLLAPNIVIAHAKDLTACDSHGEYLRYQTVPTGKGQLDYDCYLSALRKSGFAGPMILHSLAESDVPAAVRFIQEKINGI